MIEKKALVVLSGGQDSTTALFWAREQFEELYSITFDYGQRHSREIEAAEEIATLAGVKAHEIVDVDGVLGGDSPLINSDVEVAQYESIEEMPGGVEPTFIPGRNVLFLTVAASRAAGLEIFHLVTGMCQADFGGYWDCRRQFVDAMEAALALGIRGPDGRIRIHTPIMNLTKAATVKLAQDLEGCMGALEHSHTCYLGKFPPCGKCHACMIRARGFEEAGIADPLLGLDAEPPVHAEENEGEE